MKQMRDQWDEIATENAFYGVLSREEFDNPADIDLDRFWETGRKDVDSFLELIGLENTKDLKMLEIGCGLGRMTHRFAERFEQVNALDVSQKMLSQAREHWKHLPNVEWILGSGEDLGQIPNGALDFVFSFWVLQHIPSAAIVLQYVRETARVLKPSGIAFLQFRALPPRSGIVTLKYYITAHWPASLQRPLRTVWDTIRGYKGTSAKFARKYEAWCGSALKSATIEKAAMEAHLEVQRKGVLARQTPGTQSLYYIFRKTHSS